MLENFLIGLALLAVGGLVTVAINYPVGYARIHLGLGIILGVAALLCFGYDVGVIRALNAAAPFVPPERMPQADVMAETVRLPWWVPWSLTGAGVFLIGLAYLRT